MDTEHTTMAEVKERAEAPAALTERSSTGRPASLRRAGWAWSKALLQSYPSRVFALTGVCYLLLTWFYYAALSHQPPATLNNPASWVTIITTPWRRYDSYYFLHIAQFGYDTNRLPAFFPLYPLLVKIAAWPLGNHFTVAALFVSWLCCWGSYCWLYRLAAREYGQRAARLAVLALACCPMSFFMFAPYSESLFLLVSFGAVERARAGRLWQASALAALGMLTRPTGILLLIPIGWEWARRAGLFKPGGWRANPLKSAQSRLALLSLGLVPLALLAYSLYLKMVINSPLAFLGTESSIWKRQLTWPWNTAGLFTIAYQRAAQAGDLRLFVFNSVDLLLVLPLLGIVLYFAVRGRLWWGAALYQLALTVMLVAVPTHPSSLPYEVLLSTQRFMLPAFPIFLLLGQLGVARPRLYRVLLIISLIILIGYTLRFFQDLFVA